jgi:hypothetical protein
VKRVLEIKLKGSDVAIMVWPKTLSEGQRFLGDKLKLMEKKD